MNFIGSGSKYLFCTMDSDDAEYYNKEIDLMHREKNKLLKLL